MPLECLPRQGWLLINLFLDTRSDEAGIGAAASYSARRAALSGSFSHPGVGAKLLAGRVIHLFTFFVKASPLYVTRIYFLVKIVCDF